MADLVQAAELQTIQRRKKMAEALLAQGADASPVNHWLQALARVVSGYSGAAMASQADKQLANYDTGQQAKMADALSKYDALSRGGPIPQLGKDDDGNPMPLAGSLPPDPRGARMALVNSGVPALQSVGASEMLNANKAETFNLKPGEKRFSGGQMVAENAPEGKEHVINGKLYTSRDGKIVDMGGPGDAMAFNRPFNADGTPNKDYQNYELMKANQGATRVQTNVNAFTPASEEAQKQFMQSTRQTYDQLKQAPVLLDNIDKAKALVPEAKGFMGPGGEGMLQATKFLNNRLGMNIKTEGVKSAEELRSRVFVNIMDNLKKMDAQPSQMQQQMMMDALGKLGTDPSALPQVLDAFGDVIRGKVDLHNQEVQGAAGRGVKFPYDPVIKLGATTSSSSGTLSPSEQAELAALRKRFAQ